MGSRGFQGFLRRSRGEEWKMNESFICRNLTNRLAFIAAAAILNVSILQ